MLATVGAPLRFGFVFKAKDAFFLATFARWKLVHKIKASACESMMHGGITCQGELEFGVRVSTHGLQA